MLSKEDIIRLFNRLNAQLEKAGITGEIYLVGGAVMCLVYGVRPSTKDVDGIFRPSSEVRKASRAVAEAAGVPLDWLNDGVKGFLSERAAFDDYLELSNLKVFTAQPEYLLAMKCLAMRIGEEFFDVDDVRYLLRFLNIADYDRAVTTIGKYYPFDRFPQKTLYALEEILAK